MTIELTHDFFKEENRAHDLPGLLEGCYKMSTFMNRLERQSQMFPNRYSPENYKGDGLELFAEALIKLSPADRRIAITDYSPGDPLDDRGVDGWGTGMNGKKASVQVKYRGDTRSTLTANGDHLSNFVMTSVMEGVDINDADNMLIITTADGLHHFTDQEMFKGKVRCLGIKELKKLVDNNNLFWDSFRRLVGV
jgi:hypothetical protein